MRYLAIFVALLFPVAAEAQATPPPAIDPWQSVAFLEGSWFAKVGGSSGVTEAGIYSFGTELRGHILARRGKQDTGCTGPAAFDCDHDDLLYLYRDAPDPQLRAIYFDNEGHVLHYEVTTPSPTTAVFLSDAPTGAPQYRLTYELKEAIMNGRFEVRVPGQDAWKTYLEWSGPRATGPAK